MRTRALLALLIVARASMAMATPPDNARIWTVTLREAEGDRWCEAAAAGRDGSDQMYTIAFQLKDAEVDLVLSYEGKARAADQVGISLDSRKTASLAVAVRGAMDRDYLGQTRSQPTIIAPLPDGLFTRAIAPAMLRSRTLTLRLGPRRFDMALYRFDGALQALTYCQRTMREMPSGPRASLR